MPKVSIVLPTYNGEEYIKNSIDSILNQTYTNWELIIVNDCSKDNTAQIIQEYANKDSRITVITNETNKKLPASLNIGFEKATGDYYTWTSDDNEYYPQAIEKMVNFLENNKDFGMVYAVCSVIGNNKINQYWGEIPATPENLLNFSVCGACFLYKKSVANDIGKYNTETFLAEDHDYWLRIRLKYNIANINDVLYKYRLHEKSLTSNHQIEARLKGIDLAIKYAQDYLKVFPEIEKYVNNNIKACEFARNPNVNDFEKLKKTINKKIFYKELKTFYNLNKKQIYINYIMKLGFLYFVKGLILFLKQTTKKK